MCTLAIEVQPLLACRHGTCRVGISTWFCHYCRACFRLIVTRRFFHTLAETNANIIRRHRATSKPKSYCATPSSPRTRF